MAEATEEEVVKTADRLAELDTPTVEEKTEQPKEEPKATEEVVEETVPNDPKEAGRAFQEMRKALKEKEERLKELEAKVTPEPEVAEQQFENPNPIEFNVPTIAPQVDQNQFFNPETGEFDANGYQNYVLSEARREAQRMVQEEKQQAEAVALYPELKDSRSAFYQATKGILLTNMVEGKNLTIKQAAEVAASLSKKEKQQLAAQGAEQALRDIAAKESASLEATGNSGRVVRAEGNDEAESLRDRSRGGSPDSTWARAERLDQLEKS